MTYHQPRSALPRQHKGPSIDAPRRSDGPRCHPTIQIRKGNAEPIPTTSNHGRMLQLRKERTFRKRMPPAQERTSSMEKTIQGRGSHLRGDDLRRTVGKRQPSGISADNHHPREIPVVKPEEDPPYRVRTARYDSEQKIMIQVRIQGTNGNECTTTALVDSGASENFIDKAYAEASGIPMQQKTTPRRVLTVDRSEVTGGPVTHDAQIHLTINHHKEDIRLHCITIGNAPIILGLPWLKLHGPVIGWKNHTVKFHSDHCAEKCLLSSPRANTVPEE